MQDSFKSLGLSAGLVQAVSELGYAAPTQVQVDAIPALLDGRDVVGQSRTGSGKTAAFGLPILQGIDLKRRSLQALVMCPTRELAGQVTRELRKLGRAHGGLVVAQLIGGESARSQREALERGLHIAVGTPGRLLDHIEREALDPAGIQTVVLDEADRMLDMGFEEQVSKVLKALPVERQTVLFSATFPDSIEAISKRFQKDALRVTVETPEDEAEDIRQLQVVASRGEKLHALCGCLHDFPHESALIFCNFKASVAELQMTLGDAGLSVGRLDGDLDQFEREQVLARFRNQSLRYLIATDVAGRGLDVEGLDLVINYELPQKPDIYVHRIGRTGRAGRRGVAISLSRGPDDLRVQEAEEVTGRRLEVVERNVELRTNSLLRGLALPAKMQTIQIAGGRKDKLRPGDILGALTGKDGVLGGREVGKIEVHERITYVAVAREKARQAAGRLERGRIKTKRFRATLL